MALGTATEQMREVYEVVLQAQLAGIAATRAEMCIRDSSQTAVELARRWGADETDAARAGILHDVTLSLIHIWSSSSCSSAKRATLRL